MSLFWLLVLVGVHFALELLRQRRLQARNPIRTALWEIKLDGALLLLSLTLAIYMDVVVGILGLRVAARAGSTVARASARFEFLRRSIRTVLLMLDDLVRIAGFIVAAAGIRRGERDVPDETSPHFDDPRPSGGWTWGDRFAVGLAMVSGALLISSPWLAGHGMEGIWAIALRELHPFPP
ncbi:hypothetical protein [Vulgatibacter incomptus]|uniref:hypothetical protein n=1 Tax=Vulgatibacter incomptus TaxID=1391653 RepID=UPI0012F780E7|nr:hypothetical protein [Vulgatibacter incomptus]